MDDIKIGDKFWIVRDGWQHRSTRDPMNKYEEVEVWGETSRSWLVGPQWAPRKIPKRNPLALMTIAQVKDRIWADEHRHEIARLVGREQDVDVLRQVAGIIGYSDSRARTEPAA